MSEDKPFLVRSPYQTDVPLVDLVTFLKKKFNLFLSKCAVRDLNNGLCLTFKEVDELSVVMATYLRKFGVGWRDRVVIFMENCGCFGILILAILSIGACPVLINCLNNTDDLRKLLDLSVARVIISDPPHKQTVLSAAKQLNHKTIQNIFELKEKDLICIHGKSVVGEIKNNEVKIKPERDAAFILFSSGTTGLPKATMLSHLNFITCITQYLFPPFLSAEDPNHCILYQPLSHGYGLSRLITCFASGRTALVMKKFKMDLFLHTIQKYKVTSIQLVPPVAVMMINSPLTQKYNLSHLKIIFSSAAPMGAEVEWQLKKKFGKQIQIVQAYGLTECTGTGTQVPLNDKSLPPAPHGSVGILYPNTIAKIIDPENKKVLGPNKSGEIMIKGSQVMLGYYGNKEATDISIDDDGFLHTGDIGYYDENGYFFIKDRLKEMIKFKGLQVAPAELESVLLSHPMIEDAAVTGVPHLIYGECPQGWVVKKKDSMVTEQEVMKWVESKVANYKRLSGGVRFVEKIPKSSSGKILRKEIRQTFLSRL